MKFHCVITFLVVLFNCSNDDVDINSFEDDTSIKTLNGEWKVISFENHTEGKIEYKNQENSWGHDIVITFDDTKDPHELLGKNTTNSVFGKFEYVGSRQFKLQELSSTFITQPAWADKFSHAVLEGEVTYIINRTALRIYYDNKTKSITLLKQ
jgi:hypothetical protein